MPETMTRPNSLGLDARAVALRPTRLVGEEIHYYEAVAFPADPWAGVAHQLRVLKAVGMLKDDGSGCLLDILGDQDTVVQDYRITLKGLRYLIRKLKLRRDRGGDDTAHPAAPGARGA